MKNIRRFLAGSAVLAAIVLPLSSISQSTHVATKQLPTKFELWNSKEGIARFNRNQYKNDFFQLVNFYQPQANPINCAIASSVIILNAINDSEGNEVPSQAGLEVTKPAAMGGGVIPFRSYSQATLLNSETDKIKNRDVVELKRPKEIKNGKELYDPGLSLGEVASVLSNVYKLKVELKYVDKTSNRLIDKFRTELKSYMADDDHFIIANFLYNSNIVTKSIGHISPLAAYDEESDSVLVMDVALHKNQWYWVPLPILYKAMNTMDGDHYRGYLVISKN